MTEWFKVEIQAVGLGHVAFAICFTAMIIRLIMLTHIDYDPTCTFMEKKKISEPVARKTCTTLYIYIY